MLLLLLLLDVPMLAVIARFQFPVDGTVSFGTDAVQAVTQSAKDFA